MTPEDEARVGQFILIVRRHLEEQCFWAYPPPLVAVDMQPKEQSDADWLTGADTLKQGFDSGFNASLELYRRYKYGPMERKYFRDRARRMAACCMVRMHLFLKERL
jgi:hypothetical protein